MSMEILHNGGGNPIGVDEDIARHLLDADKDADGDFARHLPDGDKDADGDSSQWWR